MSRTRAAKRFQLRAALLLALLCASSVLAQMSTGTLLLALRDSRTGAAVRPRSIKIDGQEHSAKVDASGLISVRLGGGQHQIHVVTSGYSPFEGMVTVDGDDTPVNTFELDRETSPGLGEESPPIDPRTAVLEGYVVEALLGELLPGAAVTVPDRQLNARTDEEGYFAMTIPVTSAAPEGDPVAERVDLIVARDGFVTEERRNVEIISGTTMTVTVQLDRLTSETEPVKIIDEAQPDFRLSSWRFDVTLD